MPVNGGDSAVTLTTPGLRRAPGWVLGMLSPRRAAGNRSGAGGRSGGATEAPARPARHPGYGVEHVPVRVRADPYRTAWWR